MSDPRQPDPRVEEVKKAISGLELEVVKGQEFTDQTIYLDGRHFEGCIFTRCRLVTTVARFGLVNNHLVECRLIREGAAAAAEHLDAAFKNQGSPPVQ